MRYYVPILALFFISCEARPVLVHAYPADSCDTICVVRKRNTTIQKEMVAFAQTLLGTRYTFGCSAPSTGFDCSGFINYVFDHFNIDVPRSSVEFTDVGTTIELEATEPGDLILFTGTNSKIRKVGHIGMIIANDTSGISFIHSSSGAEQAVIITQLNEGYMQRFVKVIRVVR